MAIITNTKTNTWDLENKHVVTYTTNTFYEMHSGSQTTWTVTTYVCSCGLKTEKYGAARKSVTKTHNTWNTPSKASVMLSMLAKVGA